MLLPKLDHDKYYNHKRTDNESCKQNIARAIYTEFPLSREDVKSLSNYFFSPPILLKALPTDNSGDNNNDSEKDKNQVRKKRIVNTADFKYFNHLPLELQCIIFLYWLPSCVLPYIAQWCRNPLFKTYIKRSSICNVDKCDFIPCCTDPVSGDVAVILRRGEGFLMCRMIKEILRACSVDEMYNFEYHDTRQIDNPKYEYDQHHDYEFEYMYDKRAELFFVIALQLCCKKGKSTLSTGQYGGEIFWSKGELEIDWIKPQYRSFYRIKEDYENYEEITKLDEKQILGFIKHKAKSISLDNMDDIKNFIVELRDLPSYIRDPLVS